MNLWNSLEGSFTKPTVFFSFHLSSLILLCSFLALLYLSNTAWILCRLYYIHGTFFLTIAFGIFSSTISLPSLTPSTYTLLLVTTYWLPPQGLHKTSCTASSLVTLFVCVGVCVRKKERESVYVCVLALIYCNYENSFTYRGRATSARYSSRHQVASHHHHTHSPPTTSLPNSVIPFYLWFHSLLSLTYLTSLSVIFW